MNNVQAAGVAVSLVLASCIQGCSEYPAGFKKNDDRGAVECPPAVGGANFTRFTEGIPAFLREGYAIDSSCNLERVDGRVLGQAPVEVKSKQSITAAGWAVDVKSVVVPEAVVIRAISEDDGAVFFAPVALSIRRDDVVAHVGGGHAYSQSGFDADVDLGDLRPGSYRLQLAFSSKGRAALCDNGRRLVVTK